MQFCLKLILNSIYGKNIIKPHDTQIKTFKVGKQWEQFLYANYQHIKNYTINKNQVICYIHKPTNQHFNMSHIGCEILSMSKHIINRVIYMAEEMETDQKPIIHYSDTDSAHVNQESLQELIEKYQEKL